MLKSFRATMTAFAVAGVTVTALTAGSVPALAATGSATVAAPVTSVDDGLQYVPIKEPFTTPVGHCDPAGSTVEMVNCFLKKVRKTDKKIDRFQEQRFDDATTTKKRKAYLKNDAAWLKARAKKVEAAATASGGTIDQINAAGTMLKISKKRLSHLSD